jgi:hypothetical protein
LIQKADPVDYPVAAHVPRSPFFLPQDLFVQRLGFVCKKEWQFEKITSIPLKIRLGSAAYTDYMERKPNAFKPQ